MKKILNPIVLENKVQEVLQKIEQKNQRIEEAEFKKIVNQNPSISDSQQSQKIESKENEGEKIIKEIIRDHFLE